MLDKPTVLLDVWAVEKAVTAGATLIVSSLKDEDPMSVQGMVVVKEVVAAVEVGEVGVEEEMEMKEEVVVVVKEAKGEVEEENPEAMEEILPVHWDNYQKYWRLGLRF